MNRYAACHQEADDERFGMETTVIIGNRSTALYPLGGLVEYSPHGALVRWGDGRTYTVDWAIYSGQLYAIVEQTSEVTASTIRFKEQLKIRFPRGIISNL